MSQIYLDFNASTPIASEVSEAMRPYLTSDYGNPSSPHWTGNPAHAAVERARSQVAALLGCSPSEIVFTSGGTEANNHAIKGAFYTFSQRGRHIITTQVEHPAVIQTCRFLESLGAAVTYLPVDAGGIVDPNVVAEAVTDETILISVMHANNEVGTIQPLVQIARIARARGIVFHTDAAQSVGKIATSVEELGVDLLSVAGHKVYAPKGVGALYIRSGINIGSFLHGAGHEGGRRAGTENVLLNVGLGAACELAQSWIGMDQVQQLRDDFWDRLRAVFSEGVVLSGDGKHRLPNTLNVCFVGHQGGQILANLKGVAASTGSACHEGTVELSPVLQAMGVPSQIGMGAIRFSLGRTTTAAEIDEVVKQLKGVILPP